MSLPPQKFRELCLQMLYALGKITQEDNKDLLDFLSKEIKVSRRYTKEAFELITALNQHASEIDEMLRPQIKDYTLERLYDIDHAILKLIVYELFFVKALSERILISEAVRLARKFSTPEAGNFVNGILDGLVKKNL